jgi:hypothetical protein
VPAEILIDTEQESGPYAGPKRPKQSTTYLPKIAESWIDEHLTVMALVVVLAGFAIRVWAATKNYLNPDEALHYVLIHQPSAFMAYKASLTTAHPPLFFLILYFWHFLGRSELMLRLPSVLAGTAFCWLTFKWIALFFGRAAGLIGLFLATFSPAMIGLSAEVREYALLLCCTAAALYFLGRAFQEKSSRDMWYFSGLLYLAILSHYSVAFFAITVGLYAVVRIADSKLPRRVVVPWAVGQLGALAIYGILYRTHLLKIKTAIPDWVIGSSFDHFYFRLGYQDYADLFDFLRENTAAIFKYMFPDGYLSQIMLLLFVAGVVLLFIRGLLPPGGAPASCHLGILVTVPFLAVWGAAMAGTYPYIGSRHTVFLAPFCIAAMAFLLTAVVGNRLWAGLFIATVLMGFSNASANTNLTQENWRRPLMFAAMTEIQSSIPRSDFILVDSQSSLPLAYYLCDPKHIFRIDGSDTDFYRFWCSGYSIVALDHLWKLTPGNLAPQAKRMAQTFGLKSGDRFWVFQAGWEANLNTELPAHLRDFRCLSFKSFGPSITIIPFVVDQRLMPSSPTKDCVDQATR